MNLISFSKLCLYFTTKLEIRNKEKFYQKQIKFVHNKERK